jgi:ACS family tartrate transporter-like MFS transporter
MPLILSSYHRAGSALAGLHGASDASRIAGYATIPYLAAAIFTVVLGYTSDRSGERRLHIAGCLVLSAAGFAWAGATHSFAAALIGFTLAAIGFWSIMGPFWTVSTRMLSGQAAAGGVAIIQILGGIGGFLGPYLTGRLRDATHGFAGGLYVVAVLAALAAALCFGIPQPQPDAVAQV